jgi:hypothetical protein
VNFKLVRLGISGKKASFYSILPSGSNETLFETFIKENQNGFKDELLDIVSRIRSMSNETGAREQYFKPNEGKPGDGVCALYDNPDKHLRLYCIRYGTCVVILGGGGHKAAGMRTLQESDKLTFENDILRTVSKKITERIKEKDIRWVGEDLDGDFNFNDDE